MSGIYAHLGPYSDLVAVSGSETATRSNEELRAMARLVLASPSNVGRPQVTNRGHAWTRDGVTTQEISWSAGFGPPTEAWLLKPADMDTPRAGLLVFHDHGAFKYFGKEKIADGPEGAAPGMARYRSQFYDGAAISFELAKQGFVVLVHDAFAFGSRRFPFENMPTEMQQLATLLAERGDCKLPWEIRRYNAAAILHEHLIEKYCAILGGSFAALVAHDDRVALDCLLTLPEIDRTRIGCFGLSGGGARAVLLRAVRDEIRATVVAGMMSTYERLLDRYVQAHSWLFFPRGGKRLGDWPDLAACAAPSPLLVQYNLNDELFSVEGMQAAHARIGAVYQRAERPENYQGRFYPGPHKCDLAMQGDAFLWLQAALASGRHE
jgi:dienelactone hydrolase